MTKNEEQRLKKFIEEHKERIDMWHGYFILHKPYADKHGIDPFQMVKNLNKKCEFFAHPAKHIQRVNLWIKNYYNPHTSYFHSL